MFYNKLFLLGGCGEELAGGKGTLVEEGEAWGGEDTSGVVLLEY